MANLSVPPDCAPIYAPVELDVEPIALWKPLALDCGHDSAF